MSEAADWARSTALGDPDKTAKPDKLLMGLTGSLFEDFMTKIVNAQRPINAQLALCLNRQWLGHAWRTYWVTMVGFGIAIVVGVLLGFVIGSSRVAYAAVYPLMTAFNALPKAAFVPILVVWFGIGAGPAILTAFLISFFPIMVNIATGLATLEPELEDVLRVLGAKRWDVLTKVELPRSMPYFFGSLKVAITLAFVGTTVSEMTASNEGIGYLLISAGSAMQMGLAFAGLVVVGAMAMVMYELFDYVERHTTAWAHRGSQNS